MKTDDLRRKNDPEIADMIYDTLMGNSEFRQFDVDKVQNSYINTREAVMEFQYGRHSYTLTIS